MQDHIFNISGPEPQEIEFSSVFNVAVPHVDGPLEKGYGEKTAIQSEEGSVTYGQIADQVNRAGNALLGLGYRPGDRLIMAVKDCPDFAYIFWGAIKAGLLPAPLSTMLRSDDYRYVIKDSESALFVYSPEFASEVEPALDAGAVSSFRGIDTGAVAGLMAEASASLEAHPTAANDDCFFMYSSGSTGLPKGSVHQHHDLIYVTVYHAWNYLRMTDKDLTFSAAKLFFAYGLVYGLTAPMLTCASTVLLAGRPTPESTFDIIESFKPTLFFSVPTLYGAQLQAMAERKPDLESLRVCFSAGEPLPAEILRRWKDRTGLTILDGIGSTEAGSLYISNRLEDVKPGSTGKVIPGFEIEVRDENGVVLGPNQPGTLWVRGKTVATHYLNDPEKSAKVFQDGWLNTGDTYIIDEEGYYTYEGRSNDMMKVGGIWCSPFEIESVILEHPSVAEVAVVGHADGNGLTKPAAYIVLGEGAHDIASMERELLDRCKSTLAPFKYPRWFEFVDDLPKTATGKVQRFKLRR